MTTANGRTADHSIDKIFLERWSPRAFTEETISAADLNVLLEAARWAPSSYNSQPWRFLYARRGTAHWDKFLDLLIPFNQGWAKGAAALIVVVSKTTMRQGDKDVPSHSHSFDTGAAWAGLALQATLKGWQAHGMVGFDMSKAAAVLNVPEGYRVEAAVAIGRQGDPASLPEALAAREKPSPRNPLGDIAFEGGFPKG